MPLPNRDARRRPGLFEFSATEALIVGGVTAIVQFSAAYWFGVASETDFSIFQRTTARFIDGGRMYSAQSIDFTPPLFHILLLPLAHLDPRLAFVFWTALNVAVGWIVFRLVVRAVPGALSRRRVIGAWILSAAGVQMTIRLGQVSWILALLVTLAWLAARSSRATAAGVWTGLAIAFKPFLLLALPVFVLRRQWRTAAMCLATIAACCGLSLVVFGRVACLDWTANLRAIPEPGYATHFLNASWVGVVSRAHAPYLAGTLLSGATIAVMLWRVRSRDEDEAWLLLSIAAILACPIGWIYYQPMLLGPVVALALGGRLTHLRWVALTCLVPPLSRNMFQHGSVLIALTLGSVYFWGFLAVFVDLILRPSVAMTVGSIPTRLPQPRDPLASAHA